MSIGRVVHSIFLGTTWLVMLFLSVLLLWNIWFYIEMGAEHPFIVEKQAEIGQSQAWYINLVLHVIAASACIVASLSQFSKRIQTRLPKWHRFSGRLYVYSVLLIVAPTGLYMGLFAKGGALGISAFLLMGGLAFVSTFKGLQMAIRRNIPSHRAWMVRSYSMLATALSFRVYHIVLHHMGVEPDQNYLVSLWVSVLGNWLIAELIINKSIINIWRKPYAKQNHLQPITA